MTVAPKTLFDPRQPYQSLVHFSNRSCLLSPAERSSFLQELISHFATSSYRQIQQPAAQLRERIVTYDLPVLQNAIQRELCFSEGTWFRLLANISRVAEQKLEGEGKEQIYQVQGGEGDSSCWGWIPTRFLEGSARLQGMVVTANNTIVSSELTPSILFAIQRVVEAERDEKCKTITLELSPFSFVELLRFAESMGGGLQSELARFLTLLDQETVEMLKTIDPELQIPRRDIRDEGWSFQFGDGAVSGESSTLFDSTSIMKSLTRFTANSSALSVSDQKLFLETVRASFAQLAFNNVHIKWTEEQRKRLSKVELPFLLQAFQFNSKEEYRRFAVAFAEVSRTKLQKLPIIDSIQIATQQYAPSTIPRNQAITWFPCPNPRSFLVFQGTKVELSTPGEEEPRLALFPQLLQKLAEQNLIEAAHHLLARPAGQSASWKELSALLIPQLTDQRLCTLLGKSLSRPLDPTLANLDEKSRLNLLRLQIEWSKQGKFKAKEAIFTSLQGVFEPSRIIQECQQRRSMNEVKEYAQNYLRQQVIAMSSDPTSGHFFWDEMCFQFENNANPSTQQYFYDGIVKAHWQRIRTRVDLPCSFDLFTPSTRRWAEAAKMRREWEMFLEALIRNCPFLYQPTSFRRWAIEECAEICFPENGSEQTSLKAALDAAALLYDSTTDGCFSERTRSRMREIVLSPAARLKIGEFLESESFPLWIRYCTRKDLQPTLTLLISTHKLGKETRRERITQFCKEKQLTQGEERFIVTISDDIATSNHFTDLFAHSLRELPIDHYGSLLTALSSKEGKRSFSTSNMERCRIFLIDHLTKCVDAPSWLIYPSSLLGRISESSEQGKLLLLLVNFAHQFPNATYVRFKTVIDDKLLLNLYVHLDKSDGRLLDEQEPGLKERVKRLLKQQSDMPWEELLQLTDFLSELQQAGRCSIAAQALLGRYLYDATQMFFRDNHDASEIKAKLKRTIESEEIKDELIVELCRSCQGQGEPQKAKQFLLESLQNHPALESHCIIA